MTNVPWVVPGHPSSLVGPNENEPLRHSGGNFQVSGHDAKPRQESVRQEPTEVEEPATYYLSMVLFTVT